MQAYKPLEANLEKWFSVQGSLEPDRLILQILFCI